MKRYKNTAIALCALVLFFIIFPPFSLKKLHDCSGYWPISSELKVQIAEDTRGMTGEEIRKYSIRQTAKQLSFNDRNDAEHGRANCVGYAQLCAAIANYAYRTNGLRCSARPVRGYVMCYGVNLCNVLKTFMPTQRWKAFVSDHDFVEFQTEDGAILADACIYDYLFTDCKTTVK